MQTEVLKQAEYPSNLQGHGSASARKHLIPDPRVSFLRGEGLLLVVMLAVGGSRE